MDGYDIFWWIYIAVVLVAPTIFYLVKAIWPDTMAPRHYLLYDPRLSVWNAALLARLRRDPQNVRWEREYGTMDLLWLANSCGSQPDQSDLDEEIERRRIGYVVVD